MKLKKFLALALAVTTVLSMSVLTGCSSKKEETSAKETTAETTAETGAEGEEAAGAKVDMADIKIGFIFLHDENSTYDKNFIDAANAAKEALGLSDEQVIFKTNIPESSECYEAAADLADRGCNIVFADSFGHEQYIAQAAAEFPEVQFCHATGTTAHTAGLANFHNAFASIYEGRYLAGVAAGMKLNEMIAAGEFTEEEAKMGYVGAYTYAEVISGYTSFYLGAKSVCPTVTMDVQFTGSWYDETAEKEAANTLINGGCKLISQHADSMGAPTACETANDTGCFLQRKHRSSSPNTFIVSSRINWEPYFEYAIKCVAAGTPIDTDWCGSLETGSVVLTELGSAAAEGTQEAIDAAKADLIAGKIHTFDTSTFTVNGEELTSYMADVDTDAAYEPDHEVVLDGYFHESGEGFRSAPYFNVEIDGIKLLDSAY